MTGGLPAALALSLAALAGAAAAHWALRRLSRRLPRLLGARAESGAGVGSLALRLLELALLLLALAIWIGAALLVAGEFEPLRVGRLSLARFFATTLHAPLFTSQGRSYTVVDLLVIPAVLVALWIGIGALARLFRTQVLARIGIERGAQESFGTLARYVLMLLGTLVVLEAWGLDARSVAIALSVLGVGIGFGLQNIANNFVSGILIGFERPITPGDFIHVGGHTGTVEKIGARSTQLRTEDGATILIPNSRFLEQEVINWSLGDPTSRIHVTASVAHGTNLAEAKAVLLEAARSHPAVLRDPRPKVRFLKFGDSALELDLLVWTADPRGHEEVKSEISFRIEEGLRRRGIEIPFPRRDVNLRSPSLERVMALWVREHGGEEAAVSDPPPPAPPANAEEPAWADLDLDALVARMRGPYGVSVQDRRHLVTTYPKCFVGREAVDWLVRSEELTRAEAAAVGRLLVERGHVRHVLDEHGFEDGRFFYRFAADAG